ncbi:MAG: class I SAM-dependent RNA methyltransferase [Desulfobacterales bacterium]|nr:class I SAM-dependent RNA methyltransferase [Desulfobacterales bacterium]
MEKLFAVCAPGLEPFTALELVQLVPIGSHCPSQSEKFLTGSGPQYESGGIEFQGSLHDVYRANLYLRTASRVLVRLGEFNASAFPELRRKASRLLWENYLAPERPIALRVTCQKSRLYHEGAVAERLAGAIADRLGKPPPIQKYHEDSGTDLPQLIVARLVDNLCTISIDSSGALLHRRGYRLATAKAPLRETLSSAMVMASGWDTISPFLDPFCGSGTIPIEAALLARRRPAGYTRRFAFMDWPNFDSRFWNKLLAGTGKAILSDIPNIIASDRDAGAIQAAQANAERAGVADCIEFSRRAISAIDPPLTPGWVVTNPPYGVRLRKTDDLRNLYAQFGKVLRSRCPGWHVTLLCDNVQLIRSTGLEFDRGISMMNGGLKVRLVRCLVKSS